MADKAVLFDATRCTACRGCQAACKQWNQNDEHIPTPAEGTWARTTCTGSYENPPDLSPATWLLIEFREVEANGRARWLFTRRACMHCTDAGCVGVCPNGSLYHDQLGFVAYNKDTCSGCGYCIEACPFNVPRYTRNVLSGIAKADKCTLCTTAGLNRIAEGQVPACVKACPPKALHYGDRSELVADAKKRVQTLQSKGFADANLYGDKELGGLHVLYVIDESPALYGLPPAPRIPPVSIAWQQIVQPFGWALGGLALLGAGFNYIIARKAKLARERSAGKENHDGA